MKRLNMKKTYEEDINAARTKPKKKEVMLKFLSNMGHNISKSITNEETVHLHIESRSKKDKLISQGDSNGSFNQSSWQPSLDSSSLEVMSAPPLPRIARKVGVSSRVHEAQVQRPGWLGRKCASGCGSGFNSLSQPLNCKGCGSYTHNRTRCLSISGDNNDLFCKVCVSESTNKPSEKKSTDDEEFTKVQNFYKCNHCDQMSKEKANLTRHIRRKHNGGTEANLQPFKEPESVESVLKHLQLDHLLEVFIEDEIDIEVLKELTSIELKSLGIKLGPAKKILKWISSPGSGGGGENKINSVNKPAILQTSSENELSADPIEVSDSEPNETFEDELGPNTSGQRVPNSEPNVSLEELQDEPCVLCEASTEHRCRKCNVLVCTLFCSIKDPTSDNEMHRIHKSGKSCHAPRKVEHCDQCGDLFSTKDDLKLHVNRHHKVQVMVCPYCDKTFKDIALLKNHIEIHTKEDTNDEMDIDERLMEISEADDSSWRYIKCNVCQNKFYNEVCLENHKRIVHEENQIYEPYPCNNCSFKGDNANKIENHMKEKHINLDEFSLEEFGVAKLPERMPRKVNNFSDLKIDEFGNIDYSEEEDEDWTVDGCDDAEEEVSQVKYVETRSEYWTTRKNWTLEFHEDDTVVSIRNDEMLLCENDSNNSEIEIPKIQKRKPTSTLISPAPKKTKRKEANCTFTCEVCGK